MLKGVRLFNGLSVGLAIELGSISGRTMQTVCGGCNATVTVVPFGTTFIDIMLVTLLSYVYVIIFLFLPYRFFYLPLCYDMFSKL